MDASSRGALAAVRERLDELTRPSSGLLEKARERLTGHDRAASSEELLALAEELFSVARLLDGQVSLRRALSDPSATRRSSSSGSPRRPRPDAGSRWRA